MKIAESYSSTALRSGPNRAEAHAWPAARLDRFKQRLLHTSGGALLQRALVRFRYGRAFVRWRVAAPCLVRLYHGAIARLNWWPLEWRAHTSFRSVSADQRVVYYLWFFPLPSETFIQREILALMNAGITVDIVAHETDDSPHLSADGHALTQKTEYLPQLSRRAICARAWPLLLRCPFTIANLFLYTVLHVYDGGKSPAHDIAIFARALQLAIALREKRAGRIHTPWASIDAFVALLAARMVGIPHTVHARAYDLHRHSSAAGLALKLCHASAIITNSAYNQEKIRTLLPESAHKKIRIIYNGIDLERFDPAPPPPATNIIRIFSVGNLVEPKGFEYLFQACASLKAAGHEISCEIIGGKVSAEMNYYLRLRKLLRSLELEDTVQLLGRQPFDSVLERYRNYKIFVLPAVTASHGGRDITPNVLIEAMAMALPVISTRSGAIAEIIDDGVNGILVPPRDAPSLADAILRLHHNPPLARALGLNARSKIAARFDIRRNVNEFVEIFTGKTTESTAQEDRSEERNGPGLDLNCGVTSARALPAPSSKLLA